MYEQISSNKRRSVALFLGFFLLYGAIAAAVWWNFGLAVGAIVVVIAVGVALTALFGGDDMAVRVAGGREVERKADAPELWRAVENLSITAGVPMPRVFISPDPSANAFAAGRTPESAVVCVNQGLLDLLDAQELEGVLAHELSHIRNYDVRLMTYAAVLAGSLVLVAQLIGRFAIFGGRDSRSSRGGIGDAVGVVVLIATIALAPIGAMIIQFAISRRREFVADASAAELTRYPQALASALTLISGDTTAPNRDERTIAHMMIAPQLTVTGNVSKLFSTHPPTEERIAALMEMAGGVSHRHGTPASQTFLESQHTEMARAAQVADVAAARERSSTPPPG